MLTKVSQYNLSFVQIEKYSLYSHYSTFGGASALSSPNHLKRTLLLLAGKYFLQRLDDRRIELCPRAAPQYCHCLLWGATRSIRVFSLHEVIGFGHGNDACCLGNVLPFQLIGIAASIPMFMMMEHRWHQGLLVYP